MVCYIFESLDYENFQKSCKITDIPPKMQFSRQKYCFPAKNCVMSWSGQAHLAQPAPPGAVGDNGKHQLTHVEGVAPVVVGDVTVVLPHTRHPPRHWLVQYHTHLNITASRYSTTLT